MLSGLGSPREFATVRQTFRASALVPRGFVVDEVTSDDAGALITVRSIETASICPGCGTRSGRVHSRYHRRLADLPIAGRPVRLMVRVRRFYCRAVLCGRRVFTERFDDDVLTPWVAGALDLHGDQGIAAFVILESTRIINVSDKEPVSRPLTIGPLS